MKKVSVSYATQSLAGVWSNARTVINGSNTAGTTGNFGSDTTTGIFILSTAGSTSLSSPVTGTVTGTYKPAAGTTTSNLNQILAENVLQIRIFFQVVSACSGAGCILEGSKISFGFTDGYCQDGYMQGAESVTPLTACGNVASPVEECDDGNAINGDGCSSTCTIETGQTCTTSASPYYKSSCNCEAADGFELDNLGVCVEMCTNPDGNDGFANAGHTCWKDVGDTALPDGCIVDPSATSGFCICDSSIFYTNDLITTTNNLCVPYCLLDFTDPSYSGLGTQDPTAGECWPSGTSTNG